MTSAQRAAKRFMDDFQEDLAEELDDMVTDPRFKMVQFDLQMGEKILRGIRIAYDPWAYDKLVKVGQDHRFSCEQIERLADMIFISRPTRFSTRT